MATRQVIFFRSVLNNTGTRYTNSCDWSNTVATTWSTTERIAPWSTSGTAKNFKVKLTTAPGAGTSRTFAFRKNGIDQSLSITISDTSTTGSDLVNTVSLSPGDVLQIKHTSSGAVANTDVEIAWTFDGSVFAESNYSQSDTVSVPVTVEAFVPAFNYNTGTWRVGTPTAFVKSIVAAAGSITAYRVVVSAAPGAGKSWVFTFYKNGTKQDGTGGTTNTIITIADSAVGGTWTGTLSLSPGDLVMISCVPSGSPTGGTSSGIGVTFTANADGQSHVGGSANVNLGVSATNYIEIRDVGLYGWGTTESARETIAGNDPFTLSGFQVLLEGAPGAGKSYTFDIRVNQASPALPPTVVISGASAVSGSDTIHAVSIVSGDSLDIREVPAGTPTARVASWSLIHTALNTSLSSPFPALLLGPGP